MPAAASNAANNLESQPVIENPCLHDLIHGPCEPSYAVVGISAPLVQPCSQSAKAATGTQKWSVQVVSAHRTIARRVNDDPVGICSYHVSLSRIQDAVVLRRIGTASLIELRAPRSRERRAQATAQMRPTTAFASISSSAPAAASAAIRNFASITECSRRAIRTCPTRPPRSPPTAFTCASSRSRQLSCGLASGPYHGRSRRSRAKAVQRKPRAGPASGFMLPRPERKQTKRVNPSVHDRWCRRWLNWP